MNTLNAFYVPQTVTITSERYAELLTAANDGNNLKNLIHRKAKNYESMDHNEVRLLDKLYFNQEGEEKENGGK